MTSGCCVALLLLAVDVLFVTCARVPRAVTESRVRRTADMQFPGMLPSIDSPNTPSSSHIQDLTRSSAHTLYVFSLFPNGTVHRHAHKQTITRLVRAEWTDMIGMTVMWFFP